MKNRGFTLIELLVVISIIGLISSIALAKLQDAEAQARLAATKQFNASVISSLGSESLAGWGFNDIPNTGGTPPPGPIAVSGIQSGQDGITSVNPPTPVDGVVGTGLYFDDSNYVWGANFSNVNPSNGLTVSFWIKPENVAGDSIIFSVPSNGNCTGFNIGLSGGKLTVNGIAVTPLVIVNDVAQNVLMTFYHDASMIYGVDTYIDGKEVASVGDANGALNLGSCQNGNWSIGAKTTFDSNGVTGYSNGFQGLIDEVNVFGGAYNPQSGSDGSSGGSHFNQVIVGNPT